MTEKRKIRICWPRFDNVCLQGGCSYCGDNEPVWISEVLAVLTPEQREEFRGRVRD